MTPRRHVFTQTLVSVLINAALSLLFGLATVHGRASVPLGGAGGMAVDFYPQTFMITLATVLAVTLATRAQIRRGRLEPRVAKIPLPRNVLLRALAAAVATTALLAPLAGLILALSGLEALGWRDFLVSKVVFGVALSLALAPLAVFGERSARALAPGGRPSN